MIHTIRFCILVCSLALVACDREKELQSPGPRPPDRWNPKIEKFSSCLEAEAYARSFTGPEWNINTVPVSATIEQVAGVAEGDTLAIDDDRFYFSRNGAIEVVDRGTLATRASLPTPKAFTRRLFLADEWLFYVGEDERGALVRTYDRVTLAQKVEQRIEGRVIDYRIIGHRLVLVSDVGLPGDCAQVYRPNLENGSQAVTAVSFLDFEDTGVVVKTAHLMGSVDFIYMNADELFLFANSWQIIGAGSSQRASHFRRVDLHAAEPAPAQATLFDGNVRDRWSVGEHAESLFVVTGSLAHGNMVANKILSFRKENGGDFVAHKESVHFGENESVQAVRYLNDKAYVVTFRFTDPLFVFDLADPSGPKVLSALESPGFSTVLREMGAGLLGGLGFDADARGTRTGLKFSLFDVADPLTPRETDRRVWSGRLSTSEATHSPKALFLRTDGQRAIFPVTLWKDLSNWNSELDFAGVLVVDRDGHEVREAARLTHAEWRDTLCSAQGFLPNGWSAPGSIDVERAVELDGSIYTFSSFGLMRADGATFETTAKRKFAFLPSTCD